MDILLVILIIILVVVIIAMFFIMQKRLSGLGAGRKDEQSLLMLQNQLNQIN